MKRMLVVIFDSEDKAYEGARALETLSEESMIAVYDDVVVRKDGDGTTTTVVKTHDTDPQVGALGASSDISGRVIVTEQEWPIGALLCHVPEP